MRLVFRRARGTASLLLAATGATLIATALLTGLAGYGRAVVDAVGCGDEGFDPRLRCAERVAEGVEEPFHGRSFTG